ncbi:hypothetical protein OROHE_025412 [Orobanche hederae]
MKGKDARDGSGLGFARERTMNTNPNQPHSLMVTGRSNVPKQLDTLESVQLVYHKILKKDVLLYFMTDGRVYKVTEDDVKLKTWEELEHVLYLFKVKNQRTYDAAEELKKLVLKSKKLLKVKTIYPYVPKYINHEGKVVEMKWNSTKLTEGLLGEKFLEFNSDADKVGYIKLGANMKRNKINDLRAAIYQTGEFDPELMQIRKEMIAELEAAERQLLKDYLRTIFDVVAHE